MDPSYDFSFALSSAIRARTSTCTKPDGIVYEQDLGPETTERFRSMERCNPDSTWTPVTTNGVATAP